MMAPQLSHAFRLGVNGQPVTVEQGTDAHIAEQIGHLIATRLGERVMVPGFGLTDPTFYRLVAAELTARLTIFGPDVSPTVDVTQTDRVQRVVISW